jgi:hypothetical protein
MASETIEIKRLMRKTKKQKMTKPKKKLRYSKRHDPKGKKEKLKKSNILKIVPKYDEEPDFLKEITRIFDGLRTYTPKRPVSAYAYTLQKTEWMGLLTLKLHTHAYSKDDLQGIGQKNRFDFLGLVMENLCNRKFKVKESQLNWVACEEFGISGVAHVHVLISFDYFKTNGKAEKIPKIDFSEEKGEFYREVLESVNFFWRKLSKNYSAVDLHWSPMWENEGLVNYFCKLEDGREDKFIKFSKYWEIHEDLKAA